MKKILLVAISFGLLTLVPASAGTLTVSASATPSGSSYNYNYTFSITGTGLNITDVFLGSDDLSPLNVQFKFDGSSTVNWSWLSGNTPQNYLDFFNVNNATIGTGDSLNVTFQSPFAPSATHPVTGENFLTGALSNTVTGVLAPSATSVPEPASVSLLALGIAACLFTGMRLSSQKLR